VQPALSPRMPVIHRLIAVCAQADALKTSHKTVE
jgi:hypothetical protein